MDLYTFVRVAIVLISRYIDSEVPRVCDVLYLQLMGIIPCHEIKAFKKGKCIKASELMQYIISPVKVREMKGGVLYIEIY
jgi:hypothetical protein